MALSRKHEEPQLEVVNLTNGSLNIDERYQRKLNQRHVEEIAVDWDPYAADPITVSMRKDGSLWIVNGQHEAAAARLKGEEELLAWIWQGLTVREEADLRLKKNNGKADTALEKFKGEVTKGDRRALAIVALLDKYGTYVNESATPSQGINCVGTLKDLYIEDPEILERTIKALKEAFVELKGDHVTTTPIRGLFWFLKVHRGSYRWRHFIERMYKMGNDELMRRARSHKAIAGGSMYINYYRALVEMYNYRLGEGGRLEPLTKYSVGIDAGDPSNKYGGRMSKRVKIR